MTTALSTDTPDRRAKWLKPVLAACLLAAQTLAFGTFAVAETQEPEHKTRPGASAPRGTPQPQVYRQAPQPGYAPPPQRPRYEADRRAYDGDRGRRYNNRGVAIGVGAAIIGATLGYRYYRGPNRDNVYDRCDRNFPEFDYDTGTYTNEDGDREICPYLRPYID
jgi:hypothetical protein